MTYDDVIKRLKIINPTGLQDIGAVICFGEFLIKELIKTDPDSLEIFLELYNRSINGKPEPQKVAKVETMPWLEDRNIQRF